MSLQGVECSKCGQVFMWYSGESVKLCQECRQEEEAKAKRRAKNTVYFKKLKPEAVMPKYAKLGDAGADLTAISRKDVFDESCGRLLYVEYGTGLSIEMPEGHVGFLFPRSSVTNKDMMLKNSIGVIDESYRGEVSFRFMANYECENRVVENVYKIGDRIGQLIVMPVKRFHFEEKGELSETERGIGGFGSSGA